MKFYDKVAMQKYVRFVVGQVEGLKTKESKIFMILASTLVLYVLNIFLLNNRIHISSRYPSGHSVLTYSAQGNMIKGFFVLLNIFSLVAFLAMIVDGRYRIVKVIILATFLSIVLVVFGFVYSFMRYFEY